MKTSKLFSTAVMALSLSALVACSSDEPAGVKGDVAEKDQTLYLKVAIQDVNAPGSRVANDNDHFENGTDDENKINNLQFKFFDASGRQIYQTTSDVTFGEGAVPGAPSVGKIAIQTVQVDVNQGDNMPAYVVCFANPVVWSSVTEGDNAGEGISQMNGLRNVIREGYQGNNGGFAMNNSVYFGTDPISGATSVKIVGAPIEKSQLFSSKAEADAATDGSVVDIYIERYAAKVKLSVAEESIEAYDDVEGYTLTFVPKAWGITADAPSMFAVKRFSTTAGNTAPIPTESDVQNSLGDWTQWNDAPLHRSYWACSPSYYATDFPLVSDNIIDAATNGSTGAGEVVDPYALKYYSYNQIVGENGSPIAADGVEVARYSLENTMGAAAFQSQNPMAAVPSALLVGHYTIAYNGTALETTPTFYLYNGGIYFDEVPAGVAANAVTIREHLLAHQNIIAVRVGEKFENANIQNLPASATVNVVHPSKAVRDVADEKLSEELVTLQVENGAGLYYKPLGSDEWTSLAGADENVLNYVNRQLMGMLRYAHTYTNGKCYFSIPIQHLGLTENTTNRPYDENNLLDWKKVRVGDFGLVRNHVYDINVDKISGLASGINNLENPIVTPMNTYNYYIRYTLNVLNWRIVPSQNVIL